MLNGWSRTSKTGESDGYSVCIYEDYDPYTNQWGCIQYYVVWYSVRVVGYLWRPTQVQHWARQNTSMWTAEVTTPQVSQPEAGDWTLRGHHYWVEDWGICGYFYGYPYCIESGTNANYLGTTHDTKTVLCTSANSSTAFDQAAVTQALAWPANEPFERAVSIRCLSPGTFEIVPGSLNDSFREIYPSGAFSNDPCLSTITTPTLYGSTLGLHTHPHFTTAAQYLRGNGCNGDTNYPSPAQLQQINQQNIAPSANDRNAFRCLATPLYVRSPAADRVTRIQGTPGTGFCPFTETVVYP